MKRLLRRGHLGFYDKEIVGRERDAAMSPVTLMTTGRDGPIARYHKALVALRRILKS